MKLVVIVPALNEEATIAGVLDNMPTAIPGVDAIEKIVVDDGSSDRTAEIAREHGARVLRHPVNRGVGAAFAIGLHAALEAGADIIVNIDGDGQFDPRQIAELIRPVVEGKADFATCSRFAKPELIPRMPKIKLWGNKWMSYIISAVTGHRFYDVSCGFRAYRRDTALRLNLFGSFTYTQETFLDLARKQARIVEVPLPVRGEREFGTSRVAGSLSRYALRAGSIILLSLRDTRPLVFFGTIGLIVFLFGSGAGAFLFSHWVQTGHTSPYQSLVTLSALLLILGFLLIVLALVADMLGRLRQNQEELLYLLKKQVYDRPLHDHRPEP
jgi:glycosyltransferase involved in cell wall biosynthesis